MKTRLVATLLLAACFDFDRDYGTCVDAGRCVDAGGGATGGGAAGGGAAGGGAAGGGVAGGAGGSALPDAGPLPLRLAMHHGNSSCAELSNGSTWCWGGNEYGQLGIPDFGPIWPPRSIRTGTQVQVSEFHGCELTTAKSVSCWSTATTLTLADGGVGTPTYDLAALAAKTRSLSVTTHHACAILTDGYALCWGDNRHGRLGDGTDVSSWSPVTVAEVGSNVREVFAGSRNTCAITADGGVYCWGGNYAAQITPPLPDGGTVDQHRPLRIGAGRYVSVAFGTQHICAINPDGGLWCWGGNPYAQLGLTEDTVLRPPAQAVQPLGAEAVSSVFAGENFTCAIIADGGLVSCWGLNIFAQLGRPAGSLTSPMAVFGLDGGPLRASAGAAGDNHACVISGRDVVCWGRNHLSQVSAYDGGDRQPPTRIPLQ